MVFQDALSITGMINYDTFTKQCMKFMEVIVPLNKLKR